MTRRTLPPREFRLSDLPAHVGVSSIPNDSRTVHTLFAILINDVNRSDMAQGLKMDVLTGLTQAWLYHSAQNGGDDVVVDVQNGFPKGLETDVETDKDITEQF